MSIETKKIRNVALLGHGNSGKTSLAESMLYVTGATDRLGKINDGNTVCDYDAEEIKRQITISASLAPVNFNNHKINVLDCPGYQDFVGEVLCSIRAIEAGVILCSAKDGLSVGAERSWKYLKAANKPVMFYVSKLDEEHGDFYAVLDSLKAKYGSVICPVVAPMSDGTGVIDLVHNAAYTTSGNKTSKVAVPDADASKAEDLRTMELSEEDIITGIKAGIKDGSVVPVVCGCATANIGTEVLLQSIIDYVPAPDEVEGIDPNGSTVGFVFKTLSDQFGKYNFVKIMSGNITSDMSLHNSRSNSTDKLGRLYVMTGKKNAEVKDASCGDIVAVGKMDWKTGDTVSDPKNEVELPALDLPAPFYSMAITPKTKGQDDKVASGLNKLNEEDCSFTLVNNAETKQMVTELKPARVAYREKIKGRVEAHGRHKKQSGGSGQFGDVWIRFEPQDESNDMVFAEEVFGGSVPKNFFPAVEKGLREAVNKGVLAGYPLVGLKATLYDGSYHPVDSNEMAFKTAAQLAYKEGIPNAKPTILEPIGTLKVTIPDANLGDIMSDISSKRRGTVLGMNAEDGMQIVEAEVPMAEMSSYTIDLRSMTQGRGSFTLEFSRYEEAPGNVQQKVIEEAKKLEEEE